MGSIDKSLALILIGVIAISFVGLLTVKSVNAQTIPRPSAPEFTVKVNASSLEVTIKNQPITAYIDANGSIPGLYYGFRLKDHNTVVGDWAYEPNYYVLPSTYGTYYRASNSDYTEVSFPSGSYPLKYILDSGMVDVQVMTHVGNEIPTNYENGTVYRFDGVTSDWSNTQTITLPASSSSPTPTSPIGTINTGPHMPETEPFPISTVVSIALILLAVVITSVLLFRKHRKTASSVKKV